MMSIETICEISREHAAIAAKKGLMPFIIEQEDLSSMPPFPFPFLGSYTPKGWHKVNEYFVVSSGFGSAGEAALTLGQFKDKIVTGRGYAITEAGQFQLYVGEYTKE